MRGEREVGTKKKGWIGGKGGAIRKYSGASLEEEDRKKTGQKEQSSGLITRLYTNNAKIKKNWLCERTENKLKRRQSHKLAANGGAKLRNWVACSRLSRKSQKKTRYIGRKKERRAEKVLGLTTAIRKNAWSN